MSTKRTLPTSGGLSKAQQLEALCQAAKKEGLTYGRFCASLSESQKKQIYEAYMKQLEEKRREKPEGQT